MWSMPHIETFDLCNIYYHIHCKSYIFLQHKHHCSYRNTIMKLITPTFYKYEFYNWHIHAYTTINEHTKITATCKKKIYIFATSRTIFIAFWNKYKFTTAILRYMRSLCATLIGSLMASYVSRFDLIDDKRRFIAANEYTCRKLLARWA